MKKRGSKLRSLFPTPSPPLSFSLSVIFDSSTINIGQNLRLEFGTTEVLSVRKSLGLNVPIVKGFLLDCLESSIKEFPVPGFYRQRTRR